jgi:hypothetical protein
MESSDHIGVKHLLHLKTGQPIELRIMNRMPMQPIAAMLLRVEGLSILGISKLPNFAPPSIGINADEIKGPKESGPKLRIQ